MLPAYIMSGAGIVICSFPKAVQFSEESACAIRYRPGPMLTREIFSCRRCNCCYLCVKKIPAYLMGSGIPVFRPVSHYCACQSAKATAVSRAISIISVKLFCLSSAVRATGLNRWSEIDRMESAFLWLAHAVQYRPAVSISTHR